MALSKIKKSLRIIGFSFAALLFLVFLAVFAIVLSLNTSRAGNTLISIINREIPGHVTITGHHVSLLSGGLHVEGVNIFGPPAENDPGKALASAKGIFVRINPADLIKKKLSITLIEVESPRIRCILEKDGQLDLTSAFISGEEKQASGPMAFQVDLQEVRVADAELSFTSIPDSLMVSSSKLDIRAKGDLAGARGQVELEFARVDFENPELQTALENGRLRANGSPEGIDIKEFSVKGPAGPIKISGKVQDLLKTIRFAGKIQTRANLSQVGHYLPQLPQTKNMSGILDAELDAKGGLDNFTASLALTLTNARIMGNRISRAHVRLFWADRILQARELMVESESGKILGTARLDLSRALQPDVFSSSLTLDSVLWNTDLNFEDLVLSRMATKDAGMDGRISGKLTAEGMGLLPESMKAEASIELLIQELEASFLSEPVSAKLKTRAHISDQLLRVPEIVAQSESLDVKGSGMVVLSPLSIETDLNAKSDSLEKLSTLFGIKGIAGGADLDLHLAGLPEHTTARVRLSAENLTFEKMPLGKLEALGALSPDGKAALEEFRLETGGGVLLAKGELGLFIGPLEIDPNLPVALEADASNLPTQPYLSFLPQNRLSGHVRLMGSLLSPTAKVKLTASPLDLGAQVFESATAEGIVDTNQVQITSLNGSLKKGGRVAISGALDYKGGFTAKARGSEIDLSSIDALSPILENSRLKNGILSVDVKGKGSFSDPDIQAELALDNLTFRDMAVGPVWAEGKLENHTIALSGNAGFDFNAAYGFSDQQFQAGLFFDHTRLGPYFELAGVKDLDGIITAQISAGGRVDRLESILAKASVQQLDLKYQEMKMVSAKPFITLFEHGEASVDQLQLSLLEKGNLELTGRFKPGGLVAATASGSLPVELARPYVSDLEDLTGDLDLEVRVSGDSSRPFVQGIIKARDISALIPMLGQKLQNVSGELEITPESLRLNALTGRLGNGGFLVSGRADLKDMAPQKFYGKIFAEDLGYEIPGEALARADLSLSVQGDMKQAHVSGDVIIKEGRYFKDVDLNLLLLEEAQNALAKKRAEPPVENSLQENGGYGLNFNILVSARQPLEVENNLAEISISPDMRIRGDARRPVVEGRAQVESGALYFSGRTFEVTKGVIDFPNPYELQPELDVKGESEIRDWTINLRLYGPLDAMQIELTSDPEAEQGDILSLLIFGRTSSELMNDSGQTLAPKQLLADFVENKMGGKVRDATGLDEFSVDYSDETTESVEVTVGKKLADRLSLQYSVKTENGQMIQRASAELRLLEHVLVSGFQESGGTMGGEVLFRITFR